MEFVHRPECEELREAVERGESLVHLGGGPGIGKSRTLEWLQSTLEEDYETRFIQLYATHDFDELVDDIHRELYESLPPRRRFRYRLSDVSGLWFSSFGVEFDDSSEPIDELETVAELLPDDRGVVVCLDDVHKLAEEKQDVREYLERIEESVSANVRLVSSGRVHFEQRHVAAIEMRPLPREQVEQLLASTAGVDERTVERVYEQTDGYPYYLTLLSESDPTVSADGGIPDLRKDEFRRYLEQNYLESLERKEEEFLRGTVPLVDLDEHLCSLAIPGVNRVEARRMLKTLCTRCIVREAAGDDAPPRQYRLHDKFREFLCNLESTDPTVERLFEQLPGAPKEDRRRIMDALAEIAADDSSYLESFVDQMVEPLHDDDGQVRRNASAIVARLAAAYPGRLDSDAFLKAMRNSNRTFVVDKPLEIYRDSELGHEIAVSKTGDKYPVGIADVTVSRYDGDNGAPVVVKPGQSSIELHNKHNVNGLTVDYMDSQKTIQEQQSAKVDKAAEVVVGYDTEFQLRVTREMKVLLFVPS